MKIDKTPKTPISNPFHRERRPYRRASAKPAPAGGSAIDELDNRLRSMFGYAPRGGAK